MQSREAHLNGNEARGVGWALGVGEFCVGLSERFSLLYRTRAASARAAAHSRVSICEHTLCRHFTCAFSITCSTHTRAALCCEYECECMGECVREMDGCECFAAWPRFLRLCKYAPRLVQTWVRALKFMVAQPSLARSPTKLGNLCRMQSLRLRYYTVAECATGNCNDWDLLVKSCCETLIAKNCIFH